jgi:NAD(P)H-flavin reductase
VAKDGYHPALLVSRADAGGGMSIVTIDPGGDLALGYKSPGQYAEVRIDGETGYFVLAGRPGARPWTMVMKSGGGASDVLLEARPGRSLEVTSALGPGFPMAAVRGRPLVLALSGTGIAAGPPILLQRIEDGDAGRTQVYVGAKTHAELALESDIRSWAVAGVSVVLCLSQGDVRRPDRREGADANTDVSLPDGRTMTEASGAGCTLTRGYVQDVIRSRVPPGAWGEMHIFAVGVASMVEALRALPPALGLTPDRVLTNH